MTYRPKISIEKVEMLIYPVFIKAESMLQPAN